MRYLLLIFLLIGCSKSEIVKEKICYYQSLDHNIKCQYIVNENFGHYGNCGKYYNIYNMTNVAVICE